MPLITPVIEPQLYAAIAAKCRGLDCEPISINGVDDHVHLLMRLSPAVSIARLLKNIKGSTSRLMTHEITPGESFRWQGAYSAFTVGKDDLPQVIRYIDRQKAHHQEASTQPEWEQLQMEGG